MPSCTETLGLVILEAMSTGMPVVAARAGGIPELIEEGVSGFLFGDESEAVSAIREVLGSPERRRAIGENARAHSANHSWKAATGLLLEHYRTACAEQCISFNNGPPTDRSLGKRAKSALGRTALFAARKLLP
jgi:glycosyltransferase involved in cell wall biosynthesis